MWCTILFNLSRIKDLYMFWALLAHPQEVLHKQHLVYCVLHQLAVPVLVQPTDITSTQYTKCHFCSISWGWASNARNIKKSLILNKLYKKVSRWFHYTDQWTGTGTEGKCPHTSTEACNTMQSWTTDLQFTLLELRSSLYKHYLPIFY
jgi:hypothetical protein